MKKIPTIYKRDWNGDRSRVVNEPHPDCAWVFAGEGVAMQKLDGTSCMVSDGTLFKRRELKAGQLVPSGFVNAGHDTETGKTVGWVPTGNGPEDAIHRSAFQRDLPDGTYELIGPKVQGNPERASAHGLVSHKDQRLIIAKVPTDFNDLRDWLEGKAMEGIVWHHPDGRMAKIKLRDFGLRRGERLRAA